MKTKYFFVDVATMSLGFNRGIRADSKNIQCWGDSSFGQIEVPKTLSSSILFLSTGYLHSCAVVK